VGAGGMADMLWEGSAAMGLLMGRARALTSHPRHACVMAFLIVGLWPAGSLSAQAPADLLHGESHIGSHGDYVLGPGDLLAIGALNEPSLTSTVEVEADLTFAYPLIGRVRAGGRTLREVEAEITDELTGSGLYEDPLITVTVERYRSQKVTVVGEVRTPGIYASSGSMSLIDALAMAGWALPSAAGEAVIVPARHEGIVVLSSVDVERESERAAGPRNTAVRRIRFDAPDSDVRSVQLTLNDGDTVFVLPAGKLYLLGEVTSPGGYAMGRDTRTVLDGLAMAGGATNLAATSRIEIVRIVDGQSKKLKVDLGAAVLPGDRIIVPQRRF